MGSSWEQLQNEEWNCFTRGGIERTTCSSVHVMDESSGFWNVLELLSDPEDLKGRTVVVGEN